MSSGRSCPAPTQVEQCGQDFPTSESTPGRVGLGEYSTGTLDDASDRDWFRIDGLEHHRQYRLEVDFLGANVRSVARSMSSRRRWASRRWPGATCGTATTTATPSSTSGRSRWACRPSTCRSSRSNDMNREVRKQPLHGPLHDSRSANCRSVRRMVSNLEQRASDRLTFYNIGHLTDDGLTGHVKEMAIDFTTGSHAAGYTLDKLAAYISMGRRTVTAGYRHDHRRCRRRRCHWDPGLQRRRRRQDVDGARRRHDRRELHREAEHAALGRRDGGRSPALRAPTSPCPRLR